MHIYLFNFFFIISTGEVSGCRISPVQKAQFTPLGPALCWVLLRQGGTDVSVSDLRSSLSSHFPLLTLPDEETTHGALSELIKQRKVYYTGRGYSLVTADTYGVSSAPHHPPFRLLSTSEALTRAHGTAEATPAGGVTHTAVQTDLADLLTHLQHHPPPEPADTRRASLRVSRRGNTVTATQVSRYTGRDLSDVCVKGWCSPTTSLQTLVDSIFSLNNSLNENSC